MKQSCIANSTMEAEYVAVSKEAKKAIWIRKFLMELGVVLLVVQPRILFCNNSRAMTQSKKPRNH